MQVADILQFRRIVEKALDLLGDGDRLGVGEGAEIAAGAADDVGEQAESGRLQRLRGQIPPQVMQPALFDIGQDDVLLVADPRFAEAVLVGQVGDEF